MSHFVCHCNHPTPHILFPDFEYDMSLIFKNCDKYNGAKNNVHMLTLGKYTSKVFKKLFSTRMKSIERGGSIAKHPALPTSSNRDSVGGKSIGKKRPLSPTQDEKPSKRVSIKLPARASSKSIATGEKSAGKLAGSKKAARTSGKKTNVVSPTKLTIDPNVPLPMHVAISKIRNCYQGRRQGKDLEGWESDCLKFLKQLLKHPWISAERPKVRLFSNDHSFLICFLYLMCVDSLSAAVYFPRSS